ncbi:hypothetical protein RhiirA1_472888 [Rhizophagus irregularis]|uniref:Uncharacterized protein n=2 Tax=Rhizophagus irregularis TaxID=588596 RepID=A0A2I1EZZ2_9GLOM|nr:hypothetical protein RhiirA1_472888 [Rhizophagus irregularis]PKY27686.1 hypothetical protein RhiirB3_529348 [Rhizophagus irregularis]
MLRKIASSYVLQAQEEDIYNADASFPENVRNGSGESSKIATSGEVEGSETIQTSRHSSDLNVQANDQEVDVAEIDNIIAKKISCLLLESEFTLEEIWKKRSLDDLEQWKAKFSSDLKSVDADLTFKTQPMFTKRNSILALLSSSVGNTEGPIDDTKYRKDHSKLKVVMKDCLDSLWSKLHFKKVVLEEAFALGIQITGTRCTIYSLSYDNSQNFYFFVENGNSDLQPLYLFDFWTYNYLRRPTLVEMATLIFPMTFSDMEDLLPDFLENLLAL